MVAGTVLPGCSGCTPIEVTVRDAPAPSAGQPLVLVAEVQSKDGRPVTGLGLTFDPELRDLDPWTSSEPILSGPGWGDAVTDANGIAQLVFAGGLDTVQPVPGQALEGYTAYFNQGDPFQQRSGSICSDRSDVGSIGGT